MRRCGLDIRHIRRDNIRERLNSLEELLMRRGLETSSPFLRSPRVLDFRNRGILLGLILILAILFLLLFVIATVLTES